MDKIRKGSLYDEAAQRIREMIKDERLAPGTRVPEKQLCELFGISRTPLREALKVLASEGFVDLLPNRGARVVQLTRRMLQDTLDVMGSLEGLSGELACQRASDDEIATVRRLHEQMIEHYEAGDLSAYFDSNRRIHETLVAAAHNEVLAETYANLNERVRRFRFSEQMAPELWARVVREHEQMLDALEHRNARVLGDLLRAHLEHKLDRLDSALEEDMPSEPTTHAGGAR